MEGFCQVLQPCIRKRLSVNCFVNNLVPIARFAPSAGAVAPGSIA